MKDTDLLEKLRNSDAGKDDLRALAAAIKGYQLALQAYAEGRTSTKALKEAEGYRDEIVIRLGGKYFPAEAAVPVADPAKTDWRGYQPTGNKREVYRFLVAAGWRVAERTFYRHIEQGKLRVGRKGEFTASAVRRYARTWCVGDPGQDAGLEEEVAAQDLQTKKLAADIRLKEISIEQEEHKLAVLRGAYVPKDEVEEGLAARIIALEAGFDHMIYTRAAEMVALVGGDTARADLLIAALMEAKDELLNAYAAIEVFDVELT